MEQLQKFIRNVKGSQEMEGTLSSFEEMLKEEQAADLQRAWEESCRGEFLR